LERTEGRAARSPTEAGADEDFVGFNVGGVGFIMRRGPFFAAVHRGDAVQEGAETLPVTAGAGPLPAAAYFDGRLRYGDGVVPLVRLDDLLRDLFRIEQAQEGRDQPLFRAGLVARVDAFGPAAAEAFGALVKLRFPGLGAEHVAFGIAGDGAIRPVPWRELRPTPRALRVFLWNRGIVACRFREPGRLEFLIDPVDMAFPYLMSGDGQA
jgi:hypothetical protein